MNAREGVDLAKMAVVASLVCLVISSVLGVYFLLSDSETKYQRSMELAVSTTVMDRFHDFEDESVNASLENDFERYPLVSNVANALSEFNEDSLLYVYVRRYDSETGATTDKTVFTYAQVNDSDLQGALGDNTISIKHTESPTSDSVKKLLTYSKNRCSLQIADAVYGPVNPSATNNGVHYVGIEVQVLD